MIETVISSSVLIAVIAILRLFLKGRVKNNVIYALWLIAAVRLMIPFELPESSFSVMNLRYNNKISAEPDTAFPPIDTPNGSINADSQYSSEQTLHTPKNQTPSAEIIPSKTNKNENNVLLCVWFCGFAAVTIWFSIVNLKFYFYLLRNRKKVRFRCPLPVYMVSKLSSPCLFGLLNPAVYINDAAVTEKKNLDHIVSHELTHYRHGDLFWSLLRSLLTAVYWFDPFVWLGAYLSKQDCECACDESAVKNFSLDNRIEYGRTLLSLVRPKRTNEIMNISTSMASGKKHLKERIVFIGKKPENSISAISALALLLTAAACCTFTSALSSHAQNASDKPPESKNNSISHKYQVTKEITTNIATTGIASDIVTMADSKTEVLNNDSITNNIRTTSASDTAANEPEIEISTETYTENNSDEKTNENDISEKEWNAFGKDMYMNARSLYFGILINGSYFEENGDTIQDEYGITMHQISDSRVSEIEDINNLVRETFTESLAAEYDSSIDFIYVESDGLLYQKHMGKGDVFSEEDIKLEVISANESYAVFNVKKSLPDTQRTENYMESQFAITKESGSWKICEFSYF